MNLPEEALNPEVQSPRGIRKDPKSFLKLPKKVIAFDGDGTLTPIAFDSWPHFTRRVFEKIRNNPHVLRLEAERGTPFDPIEDFVNVHEQIYNEFASGNISFLTMKSRLYDLWTFNNKIKIDLNLVNQIVKEIPLREGATETVAVAKELGYKVILITASYDLFAQHLQSLLTFDAVFYNTTFQFDTKGYLEDIIQATSFEWKKLQQLVQWCTENGFALDEVLALGDSSGDIPVFKHVDGIAVSDSKSLLPLAKIRVENLHELYPLITSLGRVRVNT